MAHNLDTPEVATKSYSPQGEEKLVLEHLRKRVPVLKETKKNIMNGLNFEDIMKDADEEYMPHELGIKRDSASNIMLVQDEIKGMRGSRIVPITGQEGSEWRSNVSEPTLMIKVQTAISILVDQNPEAVFKALLEKYKPTSSVANAIWKRSWSVARSKEQLKLFIFNLAKYGWAPGRTYPRIVQRRKDILTELDTANPENNKYKTVLITEYDDIYREALDPWRTWIDDKATLYDQFSLDDWYFEKDFDRDTFNLEMGMYANADKVQFGAPTREDSDEIVNGETEQRSDIITLGFYESKNKDLYAIYSPNDDVVVYHSPLPNDDGMLSLWETVWNIRDPRTRMGIGLFEMMKNNKVLYDRLDNMDIDSLVLAIYTMLFYSGSNQLIGDGNMTISPGLMKQKLPGTTIDQVKIDYTGKGREGAALQLERMDEITGITPTLQGQVEGKTLGEVLHAKDAALKRLNIPLSNIAGCLETDAYLTLSWANQVYSLPEVKEFVNEDDLNEFIEETGREPELTQTDKNGRITADFPRVLELSLDEDRDGALVESPESRFFTVGGDLERKAIKWKGRVTVVAQSIVSPSQELERQRKLELFNLVEPVIQGAAVAFAQGQVGVALAMLMPVVQILEIQDEKPKDWMPKELVMLINDPDAAMKAAEAAALGAQEAAADEQPLMIDPNAVEDPNAPGAPAGGLPTPPGSIPTGIDPVVPRDDIASPARDSLEALGADLPVA